MMGDMDKVTVMLYILREKSLAIVYNGVSHRRYLKH